jgi:hypothetical protein
MILYAGSDEKFELGAKYISRHTRNTLKIRPTKTRLPHLKSLQNFNNRNLIAKMSSAEDIPAHYNDGNRAFLQSFLARGAMKFEDGQKVLAAIFTVQEGEQIRQPRQDMAHTS